jgi:RNA recognition motif-containing protein
MADIAAAYNLGDISSLLFNTTATSAPISKKKKTALSTDVGSNPFAIPSKSSPSPFADAARAQIVVASQIQAEETRRHQSKKSKADSSDSKIDTSPLPNEKTTNAAAGMISSKTKEQKKHLTEGVSSAKKDTPQLFAADSEASRSSKSAVGAPSAQALLGTMPQNGVVNGIVFKDGQRVTSLDVSPRVPAGDRITDPDKDARTVFVGNVPVAIKLKHIKRHFSSCGSVESVRLRSLPVASPKLSRKGAYATKDFREGASSCNAYVVFADPASISAALKLNGSELGGHHVRVDTVGSGASAQKFNNRLSLFVGNLDYRVNEEALYAHFSAVAGEGVVAVRCIRDKATSFGKGFAYVHFSSVDALSAALKLDGKAFDGRPLRVSRSDGKASIKRSRANDSAKSSSAPKHSAKPHIPQNRVQPTAPASGETSVAAVSTSAQRLKKPRHVPRPGATQPTLPPRAAAGTARPTENFVAKSRARKVIRMCCSVMSRVRRC